MLTYLTWNQQGTKYHLLHQNLIKWIFKVLFSKYYFSIKEGYYILTTQLSFRFFLNFNVTILLKDENIRKRKKKLEEYVIKSSFTQ